MCVDDDELFVRRGNSVAHQDIAAGRPESFGVQERDSRLAAAHYIPTRFLLARLEQRHEEQAQQFPSDKLKQNLEKCMFALISALNLLNDRNNIDIGIAGVAADSGIIRSGMANIQTAAFLAGVRGMAIAGGDAGGSKCHWPTWGESSSARFKEAIKPIL